MAILSTSERKCLLVAACHSSPVETVRFRLEEDFLLVSCTDGKLYIWQIETGTYIYVHVHIKVMRLHHNMYVVILRDFSLVNWHKLTIHSWKSVCHVFAQSQAGLSLVRYNSYLTAVVEVVGYPLQLSHF